MKMSPEKMVLLASSITVELCKGKTLEEIIDLKNLFNLINCNLQTYYQQFINNRLEK